jgi:hypothetical protein
MMKTVVILSILYSAPAWAGDCPLHNKHTHASEADQRGDEAMGFSHAASEHHFLLQEKGGVIPAKATDPADSVTRDAIRKHMREVAKSFAEGKFDKPEFIHRKVPPGSETMTERRGVIRYKAVDTEGGAEVRITTRDAQARDAIHQFLRFQIREHKTGDPL